MYTTAFLVSALFSATAIAHGNITSPPARLPGAAMAQACGADAVSFIEGDGTAPLGKDLGTYLVCVRKPLT
jgi:hypothetical protein